MLRVLAFFLLLFGFVALEMFLLGRMADRIGWWVVVYLALAVIAGVLLIRLEKLMIIFRLAASMRAQGSPFGALFGSLKSLVAGLLLILPGPASDVLAVVVLLIPAPRLPVGTAVSTRETVIEGEYRRDDGAEQLPHRDLPGPRP